MRQRAVIATWVAVAVATAALVFLVRSINRLGGEVAGLQQKRTALKHEVAVASVAVRAAEQAKQSADTQNEATRKQLADAERQWQQQQSSIADFMSATLDSKAVKRLGDTVDWSRVTDSMQALPPGRRRVAVLLALMATWREVRYLDGGQTLAATDGQRFIDLVVYHAGLPATVPGFPGMPPAKLGNRRGSEALIERFGEPNPKLRPQPGDLMFFEGALCNAPPGASPSCMYLASGRDGGPGICVGIPVAHQNRAAQIIDSALERDFPCRFRGYVSVPYETTP